MSVRPSPSAAPQRRAWRAIGAGLALVLAMPGMARAAPADTAAASATAEIVLVAPTSLTKTRDMVFGKITQSPVAGTVVLNAATATCTTTNGLTRLGTCQPAQFAGRGTRFMQVRVTAPTAIQLTGPGEAMTLDTFRIGTSADLVLVTGTASDGRYRIVAGSGIYGFGVGGTLRVNANQAPGVYTGTFDVTVVYQ